MPGLRVFCCTYHYRFLSVAISEPTRVEYLDGIPPSDTSPSSSAPADAIGAVIDACVRVRLSQTLLIYAIALLIYSAEHEASNEELLRHTWHCSRASCSLLLSCSSANYRARVSPDSADTVRTERWDGVRDCRTLSSSG